MQDLHTGCIWGPCPWVTKRGTLPGHPGWKAVSQRGTLLPTFAGDVPLHVRKYALSLSELWTGGAAGISGCVALMASKTLTRILSPLLNWAAPRYQAAVGDVLRKHGLRYEDLYDPLLNQVCGMFFKSSALSLKCACFHSHLTLPWARADTLCALSECLLLRRDTSVQYRLLCCAGCRRGTKTPPSGGGRRQESAP